MNNFNTRNKTTKVLKRLPLLLIMTAIAGQTMLTACASINRKEDSIAHILQKDTELIEKLQAEREQPEIVEAVAANVSLQKAENHLFLSLKAMQKANETMKTKILKTTQQEVEDGKNERSND